MNTDPNARWYVYFAPGRWLPRMSGWVAVTPESAAYWHAKDYPVRLASERPKEVKR